MKALTKAEQLEIALLLISEHEDLGAYGKLCEEYRQDPHGFNKKYFGHKTKELTDAERLEIAMSLLSERDVDEYARQCSEREQDPQANGFHDTPAECEDLECRDCKLDTEERLNRECPYLDD